VKGCDKTFSDDKSFSLDKALCHKQSGGAPDRSPIAMAFAGPEAAGSRLQRRSPTAAVGSAPPLVEPTEELAAEPDVLHDVPPEGPALGAPPNELKISEVRAAHVMMQVESGAALVAAEGPCRRSFERRFLKLGVPLDRMTQRGDRLEVARYLRTESLNRIACRSVTLITDGRKWGRLSYYPYLVWYINDAGRAQLELLNFFAYTSAKANAIRADFERTSLALLAKKAKIRAERQTIVRTSSVLWSSSC
jgi:hypothetical protein